MKAKCLVKMEYQKLDKIDLKKLIMYIHIIIKKTAKLYSFFLSRCLSIKMSLSEESTCKKYFKNKLEILSNIFCLYCFDIPMVTPISW